MAISGWHIAILDLDLKSRPGRGSATNPILLCGRLRKASQHVIQNVNITSCLLFLLYYLGTHTG
jgi:hypothetical protein